jgi:hypothetical protein
MLPAVKRVPGYGAGGVFICILRRAGERREQLGGSQALEPAVGAGECFLQGWFRVDLADAAEVPVVFEFEDCCAGVGAGAELPGYVVSVCAEPGGLGAGVTGRAVEACAKGAGVLEDNRQGQVSGEADDCGVVWVGGSAELVVVFEGGQHSVAGDA